MARNEQTVSGRPKESAPGGTGAADEAAPAATESTDSTDEGRVRRNPIGFVWAGIAGGITGILCCVGPTVLALIGVLSAGTAFTLATDLYDDWNWAFRIAGLAVTAGAIWWALARRKSCSLRGVRASWKRIVLALAVGVVTYVALYWGTTALGELAG